MDSAGKFPEQSTSLYFGKRLVGEKSFVNVTIREGALGITFHLPINSFFFPFRIDRAGL